MKKVQIKGRKVLAVEVKEIESGDAINGVYIPKSGDSKDSMIVKVLSVGEGCFKIFDPGQVYVLPRYGNDVYTINGETHYLINEDDLSIEVI